MITKDVHIGGQLLCAKGINADSGQRFKVIDAYSSSDSKSEEEFHLLEDCRTFLSTIKWSVPCKCTKAVPSELAHIVGHAEAQLQKLVNIDRECGWWSMLVQFKNG